MATKSFTAKIVFRDEEGKYLSNTEAYQQKKALWELHKKFNHYTSIVIQLILGMKNGRFSDRLKQEYLHDKGISITKEDTKLFQIYYYKLIEGTDSKNIKNFIEPITSLEEYTPDNIEHMKALWNDELKEHFPIIIDVINDLENTHSIIEKVVSEKYKELKANQLLRSRQKDENGFQKESKVSEKDFIKRFYAWLLAKELQLDHKFFLRDKLMPDFTTIEHRRKVYEEAQQTISSYYGQYELWEKDYYKWQYKILTGQEANVFNKDEQEETNEDAENFKSFKDLKQKVDILLKENNKSIKDFLEEKFFDKHKLLKEFLTDFENLIKEEGEIRKNKHRNHKYLNWLLEISDKIIDKQEERLDENVKNDIKHCIKSNDFKSAINTLREYKKIKEMDNQVGKYITTFRLNKAKWHRESGFTHPPTFTLPNYLSHPKWYNFKKIDSYNEKITLSNEYIELNVNLNKDKTEGKNKQGKWTKFYLQIDNRLVDAGNYKYHYRDSNGEIKNATISGAKLIIEMPKGVKSNALSKDRVDDIIKNSEYYLSFAVDIEENANSIKPYEAQKYKKQDGTEGTKYVLLDRNKLLSNIEELQKKEGINYSPRSLAIDLGQRYLGALTLCEYEKLESSEGSPIYKPKPIPIQYSYDTKTGEKFKDANKNPKLRENKLGWLADIPGLSFDDIRIHEETLEDLRSKQTKSQNANNKGLSPAEAQKKANRLSKGQRSFAEYSDYIMNMKEDRYKKASIIIVNTAILNGAKIIIMEGIRNYTPDLKLTKRENNRLMRWNHRSIINWIKQQAKPYGIRIIEVNQAYTSKTCSKCGFQDESKDSLGHRFSQLTKDDIQKYNSDLKIQARWDRVLIKELNTDKIKVALDKGGELFCCSSCGVIRNADINASLNLHRVFMKQTLAGELKQEKILQDYKANETTSIANTPLKRKSKKSFMVSNSKITPEQEDYLKVEKIKKWDGIKNAVTNRLKEVYAKQATE